MSILTLRAAAIAVVALAASTEARAQESFTSTDPLAAVAGAPEVTGTVVRLDAAEGEQSVYEMLTRQHAGWLVGRGPHEYPLRESVVVYVDGVAAGGKEVLRRITVGQVAEIRRLDVVEAGQRFGLGHGAGAILVTTK